MFRYYLPVIWLIMYSVIWGIYESAVFCLCDDILGVFFYAGLTSIFFVISMVFISHDMSVLSLIKLKVFLIIFYLTTCLFTQIAHDVPLLFGLILTMPVVWSLNLICIDNKSRKQIVSNYVAKIGMLVFFFCLGAGIAIVLLIPRFLNEPNDLFEDIHKNWLEFFCLLMIAGLIACYFGNLFIMTRGPCQSDNKISYED